MPLEHDDTCSYFSNFITYHVRPYRLVCTDASKAELKSLSVFFFSFPPSSFLKQSSTARFEVCSLYRLMDASFLRGVVAYDSHADGVKFQMLFMHQFVTSPALSTAGCLHKGHGPILCSRRHLSSIRHQTIRTSQLSSRFGNSPLK